MSAGILGLNGQEGAGADMQREVMPGDPARIERCKQRGREMQACGGSSHCAVVTGIDGLVAVRIFGAHARRLPTMYGGSGGSPKAAIASSR